jgi:hypothetical protein
MLELTPESDSTGDESKKKKKNRLHLNLEGVLLKVIKIDYQELMLIHLLTA